MAKAGSSQKTVYVTHKKQSATQRRINKATGVKEASGKTRRASYRNVRRGFGMSGG